MKREKDEVNCRRNEVANLDPSTEEVRKRGKERRKRIRGVRREKRETARGTINVKKSRVS